MNLTPLRLSLLSLVDLQRLQDADESDGHCRAQERCRRHRDAQISRSVSQFPHRRFKGR